MIEGQCQERVYHVDMWSSSQCSRKAVVDGKWCRQHDPEAVKARREKADKKAREQQALREREQEKRTRDRMFEPVEGWVWCDVKGRPHRTCVGCLEPHRKLWVGR